MRRIAGIANATDPFSKQVLQSFDLASKTTGVEITPVLVQTPDEIDAAFATAKKQGAEAVVVQGSLISKKVAELALQHHLPAASPTRSFAEAGGLLSYGADEPDAFSPQRVVRDEDSKRRAARGYAGRAGRQI
jgi:putative ABC transport system substrate-binding protein